MNYTQNYQLPQWVETDRILRTDFNDMTGKIESALDQVQASVDGQAASIAAKGNCQISVTSYVGTGASGSGSPNSVSFPGTPQVVMITGDGPNGMFALRGTTSVHCSNGGAVNLTWGGSSLSWFSGGAQNQLNNIGKTYAVVALMVK